MVSVGSRFHDRRDRPIDCGPACDVRCAHDIRVVSEPARRTLELRLRTTVPPIAVATHHARPRRVPWVHDDKTNACERCLVRHESSKLKERPSTVTCPLALANRYPVADSAQVFQSDSAAGVSSLLHERLGDGVIDAGSEAGLPARESLEVPSSASCARPLERAAQREYSRTHGLDSVAAVAISVAVGREVADAEVYAEKLGGLDRGAVRHIHGDVEVPAALPQHQIALSTHGLESSPVVLAGYERHEDASIKRQDRDAVERFEREDALVVRHRAAWLERRSDRPIALVGFYDLADGSHGHLRGKPELLAQGTVVVALQSNLIGAPRLERNARKPIARRVESLHRREQRRSLRVVGEQLDLSDQLHGIERSALWIDVKD